MTQTGLTDFGGNDTDSMGDARPDEEAAIVAGDAGQYVPDVVGTDEVRSPDPDGTVRLTVTQVDYTIEGAGRDEHPVIHTSGRTVDDETEHVRVLGFRPYFYAPTGSFDDGDLDKDVITGTEGSYESIRGEELAKIFGRTPRNVGQIRDEFDHYEAGILFPNRLLIDRDIRGGVSVPKRRLDDGTIQVPRQEVAPTEVDANLRVNAFDIEANDRNGFSEEGEEPIICLTSHNSYRDEYVVWHVVADEGLGKHPDTLPNYDSLGEDGDVEVRTFDGEAAMLDAFLTYIEKTNPDIFTGRNFEDFDAPYFLDRLEEADERADLNLDYNRISRLGEVWRGGWGGSDIKSRAVFDLLYVYRRTQFTELEFYRLDAVGELELDAGRERYSGDIGDLWEEDPERLFEYNLRDVKLCVEIDRKQDIIAFWDEVRTFVGCKLEDVPTPDDTVDIYVLHKVHGEFVLPSKGKQESGDYEGEAVFDPITGVKENVTVLDLKSLYPMCMVTISASPETKVDPERYDGEMFHVPNETHFQQEPDGMVREIVDELLTEREEKKSLWSSHDPGSSEYEWFDRQQAVVEVVTNSLYGVLGWDRLRLYDKEMGAAVTATGRKVIEFTEQAANQTGYGVAYGGSVTGDRPVVVGDPGGTVRILPIEDLFARGTTESEVLIAADGDVVASATPGRTRRALDGWDAFSANEDGEAEWQPIAQAICHNTDKPVVNLQHKFGESTTTRDHSYVIPGEDGLITVSSDDVAEPYRIPRVPDVEPVEQVDVYEVLRRYEREYKDGRNVGSDNSITERKQIHAGDEYVWFGHEHHRDVDSTVKVKRFVDIDSEDGAALIRLLGTYVSEGSAPTSETATSKFGANLAESDREWLAQLQRDYSRLFENTTAGITTSDRRAERTIEYQTDTSGASATYNDETLKLQMTNELAAVFFREFAGQTPRGKWIPSFVFHLPEEKQDLSLTLFIEGDGSRELPRYTEVYVQRNFDFETTNRELAAGLSMLLMQRGQKRSLKYRGSKDSYTVRTCSTYQEGQDPVLIEADHDGYVYDLSVEENENFVDGVGDIVLHNTDSVILELGPDVSKQEAIEQSFDIEEHINAAYNDFARDKLGAGEHRFQVELEKLYRRFFQAGKRKRCADHIVWKEGKDVDDTDITGFEYKRSDVAQITKKVQKNVINMIVHGEETEIINDYLHDIITDFESGNLPLEQAGIPGGISKRLSAYETPTAHVRGTQYANAFLGTNFGRGSKPERVYLRKVHPPWFREMETSEFDPRVDDLYRKFKHDPDVICFEYADRIPAAFEVDWDTMLTKTLEGPISRVIEALGMSWDEVKSGQEQTGLGSFM